MFLELGVLLSSVFTFNTGISSTPSNFIDFSSSNGGLIQRYTFHSGAPLGSILSASMGTAVDEDTYYCNLMSFSLEDNGITFSRYIEVTAEYDIISVGGGYATRAANISLELAYMDYDYQFPYLNFYTRCFYSYDSNFNTKYSFDDIDDYHRMWIGESFGYANLNNSDFTPIYIMFEFYWLPMDVYNDALLGAYPGPTDGVASQQIYQNGYTAGESVGYKNGYDVGYSEGTSYGEQLGYGNGYADALDQGATASIIFNGIISVGLLPVNVFLRMLNFEVFGINIGAFVSSLLTILVIIIIVRMFLGGKSGSE